MILFKEDWAKYPSAIPDVTTKNKSFLEYVKTLRLMEVDNHAWPLALHNPNIQGVDPFSEYLTAEEKLAIAEEVAINPWYFFREILRIPAKGSPEPVPFRANHGNMTMYWLFFNHVTTYLIQPRQTGKSVSVDALFSGLTTAWTYNTTIHVVTKDSALRNENVERLRNIFSGLPDYINMRTKDDSEASEFLTVKALKNAVKFHLGQKSETAALNVGRGITSQIFGFDEFAFIYNNHVIVPTALAAGTNSRDIAKETGAPYGTLFYTTAGFLDTKAGEYAYNIYKNAVRFTVKFFDLKNNDELVEVVSKNSKGVGDVVLIEMTHRHLGYSDDWLRSKIREAMTEGTRAEADFLLKWSKGSMSSALPQNYIKLLNSSERDPDHETISKQGYILRWYIPQSEREALKHMPFIFSLDMSDAIGNDDIGMTIRDPATGSIIAVGEFNKTNLALFSEFIFDFMMEYTKSVLIIERRSSAASLLDYIEQLLSAAGENIFRRVFNWAINDLPEEIINTLGNDPEDYIKYKSKFGFGTSGGGRTSRDMLYSATLFDSIRTSGHRTFDKALIRQLVKLEKKNGRIDHNANEHDDLVIAYLLCHWFLTNAKRVEKYGFTPQTILSAVTYEDGEIAKEVKNNLKQKEQESLLKEISVLIDRAQLTKNDYEKANIMTRITLLKGKIDSSVTDTKNIDAKIKSIVESTQRPKQRRHIRRPNRFGFI